MSGNTEVIFSLLPSGRQLVQNSANHATSSTVHHRNGRAAWVPPALEPGSPVDSTAQVDEPVATYNRIDSGAPLCVHATFSFTVLRCGPCGNGLSASPFSDFLLSLSYMAFHSGFKTSAGLSVSSSFLSARPACFGSISSMAGGLASTASFRKAWPAGSSICLNPPRVRKPGARRVDRGFEEYCVSPMRLGSYHRLTGNNAALADRIGQDRSL